MKLDSRVASHYGTLHEDIATINDGHHCVWLSDLT